jgi:DNA primase
MNYKQQLEVVNGLFIPPETELRIDCPFCNNKNTFLINTQNSSISWHCFHASCSAKGNKRKEKNMDYVKKVFSQPKVSELEKFILPDSFKSVHSNEKALMYLHKNNCWEACMWGRADIKYDVKQDRVVFLIKNPKDGSYFGAVGRGLNSKVYPKWYMYTDKNIPFKCGECKDAVIVEDCASACAVSNVLTGIAILGTSLLESHKKYINPYRKLYVALDPDASAKSFKIVNDLRFSGFLNVEVKSIKDDLKYFTTDEIEKMFYGRQQV